MALKRFFTGLEKAVNNAFLEVFSKASKRLYNSFQKAFKKYLRDFQTAFKRPWHLYQAKMIASRAYKSQLRSQDEINIGATTGQRHE